MSGKAPPARILGVTLLHKCNFNCSHCGYLYTDNSDDHALRPGYRLSWEQIKRLIAECKSIKNERFTFIFNGGEPTLWEEGELKLIDILLLTADGEINPSFNTNGSLFTDYGRCRDFLYQYSENARSPLITAISIDKFHDNYDRKKGRAECLDNIIKVLDEMPAGKKAMHRVRVITIVSNDPGSYLPREMKEYYSKKGITFGEFPLHPIGRAKDLMDEMPDAEEFFKSLGTPPANDSGEYPIATLIDEDFFKRGKKVGRLGYLKDLLVKMT